jgi:hypothetical protein
LDEGCGERVVEEEGGEGGRLLKVKALKMKVVEEKVAKEKVVREKVVKEKSCEGEEL